MRRTVRESRFVYKDDNPSDEVAFFVVELIAVVAADVAVVDVVVDDDDDVDRDRLLLKPGGR